MHTVLLLTCSILFKIVQHVSLSCLSPALNQIIMLGFECTRLKASQPPCNLPKPPTALSFTHTHTHTHIHRHKIKKPNIKRASSQSPLEKHQVRFFRTAAFLHAPVVVCVSTKFLYSLTHHKLQGNPAGATTKRCGYLSDPSCVLF